MKIISLLNWPFGVTHFQATPSSYDTGCTQKSDLLEKKPGLTRRLWQAPFNFVSLAPLNLTGAAEVLACSFVGFLKWGTVNIQGPTLRIHHPFLFLASQPFILWFKTHFHQVPWSTSGHTKFDPSTWLPCRGWACAEGYGGNKSITCHIDRCGEWEVILRLHVNEQHDWWEFTTFSSEVRFFWFSRKVGVSRSKGPPLATPFLCWHGRAPWWFPSCSNTFKARSMAFIILPW